MRFFFTQSSHLSIKNGYIIKVGTMCNQLKAIVAFLKKEKSMIFKLWSIKKSQSSQQKIVAEIGSEDNQSREDSIRK